MKFAYRPARILVVDDDLDTVDLLRMVLQKAGYKVSTATSWEEVADRIALADRQREVFDLILLDVMMPERSGFDIYTSLELAIHPMPPVIFLSAKSSIDTIVQAKDMGAAKYLVKPTTPEKLLTAVASVLQ